MKLSDFIISTMFLLLSLSAKADQPPLFGLHPQVNAALIRQANFSCRVDYTATIDLGPQITTTLPFAFNLDLDNIPKNDVELTTIDNPEFDAHFEVYQAANSGEITLVGNNISKQRVVVGTITVKALQRFAASQSLLANPDLPSPTQVSSRTTRDGMSLIHRPTVICEMAQ